MDSDLHLLAKKHGINLHTVLATNELGLDFKVVIAVDENQTKWVLRIPRRSDSFETIQQEGQNLSFLKQFVDFQIPDWKVIAPDLIAYPFLQDKPALDVNPGTHEMAWNIDLNSFTYSDSLAHILIQLHSLTKNAQAQKGIKSLSPSEVRTEISEEIQLVQKEIGISKTLEEKWKTWLDNDPLWPSFSSLVHGDLYAGHTLVNAHNEITGIIDWSEMHIGDPSLNFVGHYAGLGHEHLVRTLEVYEQAGGKTWPHIKEHIIERSSISPLKLAIFALKTNNETYLQLATEQLK